MSSLSEVYVEHVGNSERIFSRKRGMAESGGVANLMGMYDAKPYQFTPGGLHRPLVVFIVSV